MRPISIRTSCLFVLLLAFSCSGPRRLPADPVFRQLPEPPGVVYIGDSLWLDEAEMANIHWLEYLHHIRKDSSRAFYQSQLPDSVCWTRLYQPASLPTEGLKVYAYSGFEIYPGFRYFPVVGVSYTQAQAFCRWRSAVVNQLFQSAEYLRKYPVLRQYEVRVEYRLPTVAEWETAAAAGADAQRYPLGRLPTVPRYHERFLTKQLQLTAEGCMREWTKVAGTPPPVHLIPFTVREQVYVGADSIPQQCTRLTDQNSIQPEYIYANPPNANHLYNMIGNVAELTATEGVAKGGAFLHSVRDVTIGTNFPYDRPQAWLGFRCACTVRVRRKTAAP